MRDGSGGGGDGKEPNLQATVSLPLFFLSRSGMGFVIGTSSPRRYPQGQNWVPGRQPLAAFLVP